MGRRHNQRTKIALPVRIFGIDADGNSFARLAETLDVSAAGARIAGIYVRLAVGDIVGVQHGANKARFRITWTGKPGTNNAGQVGLACVEPDNQFWGITLSGVTTDNYEPPAAILERRRHCRYDCAFGVEVKAGFGAATHVKCTDVSLTGCYLETWSPLPVGTKTNLLLKLPNGTIRADGEVRSMDPAFGMGIEFAILDDSEALERYVREQTRGVLPEFDQLGKDLSFEGQESAGSRFTQETSAAAGPDPGSTQYRVLLADDSKFLRSAYSMFLRREGFQVIVADDGDQALQLARSERPDVIVLDLLMPNMGGVAALILLKQDPETAIVPVIVLSGLPSTNSAKLESAGAFAYLAKTEVGPEELPQFVRRALHSLPHRDMPHRDMPCGQGSKSTFANP